MKPPKLPEQPKQTIQTLKRAGYECYAVGGCIRDLIMGKQTHDWDFTTNARPEEILKLFPENSFYENIFGTVGLKMPNAETVEEIYEITTYRSEEGYSDRRRPDTVTWGDSIEQDLKRRDFTINAIAFDGETIVDPHGGQEDIEEQLIRAVGDPETRFAEDALRLMRAIRIATQRAFYIETQTGEAIKKQAHLIQDIAKERIKDELIKIMASPHPADGVLMLKEFGLLYELIPEFKDAFATEQKSPQRHHIYDVGTHLIESLRHCPSDDPIVRLATLLHDIGKPQTAAITPDGVRTFYNHEIAGAARARDFARTYRFSRKDTGKLISLVRWHQFSVDEHQSDKAIRRFIRKIGIDRVDDMLALRTGDRLGGGANETSWRLELFKKRLVEVQKIPFTIHDLHISGHDIMKELGLKPGRHIGELLHKIFEEVEEGNIKNEREALLQRIKTMELRSRGFSDK
jgi:putative nucleotidyltransferase with HDIG domain